MNEIKKPNLYLITDGFPFGHGESFIEPELQYLSNTFKVTIISSSNSPVVFRDENSQIDVINYDSSLNRTRSFFRYFAYIIRLMPYFFSKEGVSEVFEILKERKQIVKRLVLSFVFFLNSQYFHMWIKKEGLISQDTSGIVYFYWNNCKVLSIARRKAKYPYLKIISRLHGYDLYKERRPDGRQPFKKFMDILLDRVVFVSAYGMNYYLKTYQIPMDDRHILSRLGTTNNYGVGPYIKTHILDLVSCSNVVSLKRIHLIIEALSLVNELEIHWQHFGDGAEMSVIKKYAKEKLISKSNIRYTFHGAINNQDLLEFYSLNKVDCFITTSATEGGNPVSIMEALSFGIPIIASSVGGITEMIADSDNFLLSSNPTPDEIMNSIVNLSNLDNEKVIKLRNECRLMWEENYRASINCKKFVDMLIDVLAS